MARQPRHRPARRLHPHADLTVDPDRHEVRRDDGTIIDLTRVEFRLLDVDPRARTAACCRATSCSTPSTAHEAAEVLDRTIDVHIGRLRDKLDDDPDQPRYVADRPWRRLSRGPDRDPATVARDRPRHRRADRPRGHRVSAAVGLDHPGGRRRRRRGRRLHRPDGRGRRLGRARPRDVRQLGHDRRRRGRRRRGRRQPAAWRSSSPGCSRGRWTRSARRPAGSPTATTRRASRAKARRSSLSLADSFNQMAASARGAGADAARLHRQRGARAADAADQPAGLPRGAARRRHHRRPRHVRVAPRGGRPARPAVALARRARRRRRRPSPPDAGRARPRRRRPDRRRARARPRSSAPGSRLVSDVPADLPARADTDEPRAGPREPALERRPLHAALAARSRSGPSDGPATCSCRSRTPATGSRPRTSIGCSSASTGSRSRATARAAAPASAWPSSSSSSSRPAAGSARSRATARRGSGSASRAERGSRGAADDWSARRQPDRDHPGEDPASPTHWIGRSRSPRNATATRIVTAGPNDEASPTSQVSACLEADTTNDEQSEDVEDAGEDDEPTSATLWPGPRARVRPSSPMSRWAARRAATVIAMSRIDDRQDGVRRPRDEQHL